MWCRDVTEALSQRNALEALVKFEKRCQQQLSDLARLTRENIPKLFRKVLGALITIDVHARDIVTEMVQAGVSSLEVRTVFFCTAEHYEEPHNENNKLK
jgi:dynein heavy chain